MNPAFPEGFWEWRKVEPRELIAAPLVKEPVQKAVHKALRKEAKGRRRGHHRDGLRPRGRADRPRGAGRDDGRKSEAGRHVEELGGIGGVSRARYSALTKEEIEEAFANLVEAFRAARPRR